MNIERVKSADGTAIAFETIGKGPPLILVGGAFSDRSAQKSGTPLAALLAHRFTVLSYDRRGRGDSEDTPPYAIDREVQDLSALIAAAGGSAFVFGHSSGGLLALDAAVPRSLDPEARFVRASGDSRCQPGEVLAGPGEAARRGRCGGSSFGGRRAVLDQWDADARACRRTDAQIADVAGSRGARPYAQLRRSHQARGPSRLEQVPVVRSATLVVDGGASPPWMRQATQTLARAIPNARHRTLEGQTHDVDPKDLARALEEFLGE